MPVAFVQKAINTNQTAVTSITATGSSVTAGNVVVGAVTWPNLPIASPNIKDNLGNSATIIDNVNNAGGPATTITFWFKSAASGMTGVVFTPPSGAANGTGVEWHEVSGAGSSLDGHSLALNASSSTTQTTPSITTTANGDYIYCCSFGTISGNSNCTAAGGTGASFTIRNNDSTNQDGADSSAVQASAGSVHGTFTLGAAQQYFNGIVAIQAAAGGSVSQRINEISQSLKRASYW